MNTNTRAIIELSDESVCSREIAEELGLSRRYVGKVRKRLGLPRPAQSPPSGERNPAYVGGRSVARKVRKRFGLPHPAQAPPSGERNPAYVGGRSVARDGYVYIQRGGRRVLEHRQLMSDILGRPLKASEVVDHIDGLTLHNSPGNLRLFASNAERLAATTTGKPHRVSEAGKDNLRGLNNVRHRGAQPLTSPLVDTYRQRKEAGDVRLRQILLAALSLGTDCHYLWGTLHWLEQAGIDWRSRPNLEHALAAVEERWAAALAR